MKRKEMFQVSDNVWMAVDYDHSQQLLLSTDDEDGEEITVSLSVGEVRAILPTLYAYVEGGQK